MAILALSLLRINSIIVKKCRKTLSSLAGKLHLSVIWVPDHRNIFGNEKVDVLPKSGVSLDESEAKIIPCPLEQMDIYNKMLDSEADMAKI